MEIKFYLAHEQYQLLTLLAREGGETTQQLLLRLILKEDFERHCTYNAMTGQYQLHECFCRRCFLRDAGNTTYEIPIVTPVTRKLRRIQEK